MAILDNLLRRFGYKEDEFSTLDAEIRDKFLTWSKELEGKPVTIEELRKFLESQQTMNISEFENFENPKLKDLFIKVYSRICRQIILFISMPERTRRSREASVNELEKGLDKK